MTDKSEEDWRGHRLDAAVSMRSSKDQVSWTMFGLFVAANALLLLGLFPMGQMPTNPLIAEVFSLAGFFLSLSWFLIQRRARASTVMRWTILGFFAYWTCSAVLVISFWIGTFH